jgi:hypothetical protein
MVSSLFVHLLVLHQALDALQSAAAHGTRPTLVLAAFALLHCCSTSVAYQVFGKRTHFEELLATHQTAMFFSFVALQKYSDVRKIFRQLFF